MEQIVPQLEREHAIDGLEQVQPVPLCVTQMAWTRVAHHMEVVLAGHAYLAQAVERGIMSLKVMDTTRHFSLQEYNGTLNLYRP